MVELPETNKPDFRNGFPIRDLDDGSMISGQADGEELVLVRRGDEIFAFGPNCTHYGGPLAEGLIVDDTVRCPWHHACFSLRNGEAVRAPALDPIPCWRVERLGDRIFVREKVSPPAPKRGAEGPGSVVIVGGGAAGLAAADMLRREGYDGPLTIVSADAHNHDRAWTLRSALGDRVVRLSQRTKILSPSLSTRQQGIGSRAGATTPFRRRLKLRDPRDNARCRPQLSLLRAGRRRAVEPLVAASDQNQFFAVGLARYHAAMVARIGNPFLKIGFVRVW